MNKFDRAIYLIMFAWYLVFCWIAPLSVTDLFDNRYFNVAVFHLAIIVAFGICYAVVVIKEKSNYFND